MAALTAMWKRRTQGIRTSCHILRSTEPMRGLSDARGRHDVSAERSASAKAGAIWTHSP